MALSVAGNRSDAPPVMPGLIPDAQCLDRLGREQLLSRWKHAMRDGDDGWCALVSLPAVFRHRTDTEKPRLFPNQQNARTGTLVPRRDKEVRDIAGSDCNDATH